MVIWSSNISPSQQRSQLMVAGVLKMKKTIWILVFLIGLFVVGCTAPTNNVPAVPTGGSGPVVRSFSASSIAGSGTLTVTLTKTLKADQTTLLIEENFPAGWIIADKGTGTVNGNTIRWAEIQGAKSGTYTYTVKAPAAAGAGTWTGQYSIQGQTPVDIGGSTSVTVQ